ncbi:MAG: VIT family protein [Firmicutes bacterium]|uniref:VIT family protein n=1 Tax=Candidatus Gallilactobacillus intestinavium TaxID=2840838 RepID=A0A9D9E6M5_9LACO|nr:VIT family protein [Candidatus Gallilactobacillus intestinavium]
MKHIINMERLNTLRAGVLGSNDGILTVVGVLLSVGVATNNRFTILMAGLSDLLACAFSMSTGEYSSVSSQKDTELSLIKLEKKLIKEEPQKELLTIKEYYKSHGVSNVTSELIAKQLMKTNALNTLLRIKYNITNSYMNPWYAALSSFVSALSGGFFPLLAMLIFKENMRWMATIMAVILVVAITGYLSAKLSNGSIKKSIIRNIIVGIITMCIHYEIGLLI